MDPSRKRMVILMTALVLLLALGQGAIALGWEAALSLSWMLLGLALILAGLFGPARVAGLASPRLTSRSGTCRGSATCSCA